MVHISKHKDKHMTQIWRNMVLLGIGHKRKVLWASSHLSVCLSTSWSCHHGPRNSGSKEPELQPAELCAQSQQAIPLNNYLVHFGHSFTRLCNMIRKLQLNLTFTSVISKY